MRKKIMRIVMPCPPRPHQIADIAGYSPDLSLAQKVEVLETLDLEKLALFFGLFLRLPQGDGVLAKDD